MPDFYLDIPHCLSFTQSIIMPSVTVTAGQVCFSGIYIWQSRMILDSNEVLAVSATLQSLDTTLPTTDCIIRKVTRVCMLNLWPVHE